MVKSIMIQGTMSNAGKSIITAGLCRIFAQDGYSVAPFKSQNMALNSYITSDGLEMGRAQVVQAEAAYKEPDVRMNPILLKPTSNKTSQVIVNGEVLGNMPASEYFQYKHKLVPDIMKAYNSLAEDNDIIVLEGAGSPAEINLKSQDIVNMGMAKLASAPVLIAGDIDQGGVFASLYGTYMLQTEEEKKYIKGTIINKFRGDVKILEPGLKMLEDLINIPTLGVVPYLNLDIDDEDSLSTRLTNSNALSDINIAVIKLPRISNFTDFNIFQQFSNVSVNYVSNINQFKNPDLVIIPGTKNTMGDLKWLRESGLESLILKHASENKPVFGICGGYQMLEKSLKDPFNVEEGGEMAGLGLLNTETIFEKKKIRTRVDGVFQSIDGIFKALENKEFEGYEIHMGISNSLEDTLPLSKIKTLDGISKEDGLNTNNIYGSYVHGIFDKKEVAETIVKSLCESKDITYNPTKILTLFEYKDREYNKLADALRESLNMNEIYKILNEGIK